MSAPIYSERSATARAPEQSRGLIRTLAFGSMVIAAMSLLTSLQYGTRDGAVVRIEHQIAYFGCGAARAVQLAPARIGQPGYWRHLDQNNNGISCEPSDKR